MKNVAVERHRTPRSHRGPEIISPPRALVLGAGPVGKGAAEVLRQEGYVVTILEKRDISSRPPPIHYNMRAAGLAALVSVVGSRCEAKSIKNFVYRDLTRERPYYKCAHPRQLRDVIPDSGTCYDMLRQPSVAQVSRVDIESKQSAHLLRKHIVPRYNAHVEQVIDADEGIVRIGLKNRRSYRDRFDLIAVAEGAASSTRDKLGISAGYVSSPMYYVSGSVAVSAGATLASKIDLSRSGDVVSGIAVGHGSKELTWCVVQLPRPLYPALQRNADAARHYFLSEAKRLLYDVPRLRPRELHDQDIVYGGKPFVVQMQQVERVAQGRFYLIGDAAGTGLFPVSGGINTAFAYHLPALRTAARSLKYRHRRSDVNAAFSRTVLRATSEWQMISVRISSSSSNAPANFGEEFAEITPATGAPGNFNDVRFVLQSADDRDLRIFSERAYGCPNITARDEYGDTLAHHLFRRLPHDELSFYLQVAGLAGLPLGLRNRVGKSVEDLILDDYSTHRSGRVRGSVPRLLDVINKFLAV